MSPPRVESTDMTLHRDEPVPRIPIVTAGCVLWLALVTVCVGAEKLDWPHVDPDTPRLLHTDPWLPIKSAEVRLVPAYLTLWQEALGSPESDLRREAALAIARVHREGLLDCSQAEATLRQALTRDKGADPQVQTDIARALIAIDARKAAPELRERLKLGTQYARVVEPALAAWGGEGMRDVWLQRIQSPDGRRRFELRLAVRCLGQIPEARAQRDLLEIMRDPRDFGLQLEAARSIGMIQRSGLEATVTALLAEDDAGRRQRLIAVRLLRHHDGTQATGLLQRLAVDAEPAVAATAIERLVELDRQLILPLAAQTLKRRDARLRELIVSALAHIPTSSTVSLLEPVLGDAHPGVRRQARETLFEFAQDDSLTADVLQAGEAQLQNDNWMAIEQSSVLLGQLQHKPVARRLLGLVRQHSRREVCTAAAWALRRVEVRELAPDILQAVEREYQLIMDRQSGSLGSDAALVHLIEALGHMNYAAADAHLRLWLPTSMTDPKPADARSAAVWSLGKLHVDVEDPTVTAALLQRMNDPLENSDVLYAATLGVGRMKSESGVSRLRPRLIAPVRDSLSVAIAWADNRTTGRPMPPMDTRTKDPGEWFLVPIGSRLESKKQSP